MSRLSILVAMASNHTIGLNNTLPWRIPADLKRFKQLTLGHHLIMGRKTYESIGKPLPGRVNVIVSRDKNLKIDGCSVVHSLPEALACCASDPDIFIVGGAEIYAQSLALADRLLVTEIQQPITGDTWFPEINTAVWQEISREIQKQQSPEALDYHFVEYQRSAYS